MKKVLFDAAVSFCHTANCCPRADFDPRRRMVTLTDPSDPRRGRFTLTAEEWNALLASGVKAPDGK